MQKFYQKKRNDQKEKLWPQNTLTKQKKKVQQQVVFLISSYKITIFDLYNTPVKYYSKLFISMKLVFATNNLNKLKEVQLLVPQHITLVTLKDIGCTEDIAETADTLEGNAQLKADYITKKYKLPCFADDTGLLVNALDGAPGVFSARYAGEQKSSEDNMNLLLKKLEPTTDRSAHFKTVIALNLNNKQTLFKGIAEGHITKSKEGLEGFGYDPIFKPKGYNQTFAELPLSTKNKISHRGKAIQKLIQYLNK